MLPIRISKVCNKKYMFQLTGFRFEGFYGVSITNFSLLADFHVYMEIDRSYCKTKTSSSWGKSG